MQKILAGAGLGSRRTTEQYLRDGRVTVNGRTAKLGDSADLSVDVVALDGERLGLRKPSYWILNKPTGVVTTLSDPERRATVGDLLPPKASDLFPVGRLDIDTSGLVLLTNDGALTQTLLHPSSGGEKEYQVVVKGELKPVTVRRLEKGIVLDDGRTKPARVDGLRFDAERSVSTLRLVLTEGRKRQIRRAMLALGHPVKTLRRVRIGPLRLGRLRRGELRPLRPGEIAALLAYVERLRTGEEPPLQARSASAAPETPRAIRSRSTGTARSSARDASRARAKSGRAKKGGASPGTSRKKASAKSARTSAKKKKASRPGSAAKPSTRRTGAKASRRGPQARPPRKGRRK